MSFEKSDELLATSGARWPRLTLKQGDRARFHILSTGGDDLLLAGRFHHVEDGSTWGREILCLRSFTQGEEPCRWCDEGNSDMKSRFAVWVWAHFILHLGDNPDEDGEAWKQVKVGERTMFQEVVDKALVFWRGVGHKHSWYGQFKAAYMKYGSLHDRIYQLTRSGALLDTDYTLSIVKEEPMPAAAKEALKEGLPTIEEIFRSTLGYATTPQPTGLAADSAVAEELEEIGAVDLPALEEGEALV